jgi:hypothetical protein
VGVEPERPAAPAERGARLVAVERGQVRVIDDAQRQLLLDNPALFIVTYFPHRINEARRVPPPPDPTATTQTRSLILYPAGHGKTTLVSTLLPIWALCKDPNIRIVIIGKNDTENRRDHVGHPGRADGQPGVDP